MQAVLEKYAEKNRINIFKKVVEQEKILEKFSWKCSRSRSPVSAGSGRGKARRACVVENAVAVVGAREVHRDGSSAAALSFPLGEEEGVPLA